MSIRTRDDSAMASGVESLVRRAALGDQEAFAQLVRRFQNLVFGTAFMAVRDEDTARDATQDSFLEAYVSLPSLRSPKAFPSWLRTITRRRCARIRRKHRIETVALDEATGVVSDAPGQDDHIDRASRSDAVLAAIAGLPPLEREVVTLFYLSGHQQRDIARFMGVPVTTVNNRLHVGRTKLRSRLLSLVESDLARRALPHTFADRVGHILEVSGRAVDVRFERADLPEVLELLTLREGPHRTDVVVEVVQRLGSETVRCLALKRSGVLRPGLGVRVSRMNQRRPRSAADPGRAGALLSGARAKAGAARSLTLIETGIKVIDLFCPLVRGGSIAIVGDARAGKFVLVQELVRRIAKASGDLAVFSFAAASEFVFAREVARLQAVQAEAAAQTFFLSSRQPLASESCDQLDAIVFLSKTVADRAIYPPVDPLQSAARLLQSSIVGARHASVAARVREHLARLDALPLSAQTSEPLESDPLTSRAWKLALFLSQPFYVAEPYTHVPGLWVRREETIDGCSAILDGKADYLPARPFYFSGTFEDVCRSAGH